MSFAHRMGSVGAFGDAVTATIPDLAYEESLAGVMATTTRTENGKSQIRIADWTFPHTYHVTIPTIREDTPWAEI